MILRVCGWHPQTFGYRKLLGIRRDGQGLWAWQTSHGLCRACMRRMRARLAAKKVDREWPIVRAVVVIAAVVAWGMLAVLVAP